MKVLFDAMCRAVERNESLKGLHSFMKKCRLFHLDITPHEVLSKTMDEIMVEDHVEDFFLPFPVVAIEDRASVMMVADTVDGQRGIRGDRIFLEYIDSSPERVSFFSDDKNDDIIRKTCDGAKNVATIGMTVVDDFNVYRDPDGKLRFEIHGKFKSAWLLEDDRVIGDFNGINLNEDEAYRMTASSLKNCSACLQEILYVNNPSRFIVERRPLKLRSGHNKNGRILRTVERPVYTLLEPNRIREKLGLPEPREGGPRRPHSVRRHFRSYRSDRWVNVKGKKIVIEAYWSGPSEAVVGGHFYRVLLDK